MYNFDGVIRVSFMDPAPLTEIDGPRLPVPVYNYEFSCTGFRTLQPGDDIEDNEVAIDVVVGQKTMTVAIKVEAKKRGQHSSSSL